MIHMKTDVKLSIFIKISCMVLNTLPRATEHLESEIQNLALHYTCKV